MESEGEWQPGTLEKPTNHYNIHNVSLHSDVVVRPLVLFNVLLRRIGILNITRYSKAKRICLYLFG